MAFFNKPSFWNAVGMMGLYIVVFFTTDSVLKYLLIPGIVATLYYLGGQLKNV